MLFTTTIVDQKTVQELEQLLLEADVGFTTTSLLIERIKKCAQQKQITGAALKDILRTELLSLIKNPESTDSSIIMLVGINGSGKTTCAGKLAHQLTKQGKKVLLVAADTFRAAAREQLQQWSLKSNTSIVLGTENQDPSAVIFAGCQQFSAQQYDCMIIDTAGRLQTKMNLMQELAKMQRTVQKPLPNRQITTLLVIDGILGQNSFEQAKLFNDCTKLDGVVLTKMDGTSKGGIIFAINHALSIPVYALSYGEKIEDLALFNAQEFVDKLLN